MSDSRMTATRAFGSRDTGFPKTNYRPENHLVTLKISRDTHSACQTSLFWEKFDPHCRYMIYDCLLKDAIIQILDPNSVGLLEGLSNSCTKLRDEIQEYYKKSRRWLSICSRGIFAPEFTTFSLDWDLLAPGTPAYEEPRSKQTENFWIVLAKMHGREPETLSEDDRKEVQRLAIWKMFSCHPKNQKDLQVAINFNNPTTSYLTDQNHMFTAYILFLYAIQDLKNLRKLTMNIYKPDAGHLGGDNFNFEFRRMWTAFWYITGFCHPGKCCACCNLPSIEVKYSGFTSEGFLETSAILPAHCVSSHPASDARSFTGCYEERELRVSMFMPPRLLRAAFNYRGHTITKKDGLWALFCYFHGDYDGSIDFY
jgi:hypothetical protein